ncbi:hypothetical protein BJY01DRAFT_178837 [Aspergillus pseudoustus]|uniref:DUF6590 domain-containing protein n=1 Tax=Aspergillus pseudoustus TaxID=1810923 RepID=A0ABR4KWF7_9EURO
MSNITVESNTSSMGVSRIMSTISSMSVVSVLSVIGAMVTISELRITHNLSMALSTSSMRGMFTMRTLRITKTTRRVILLEQWSHLQRTTSSARAVPPSVHCLGTLVVSPHKAHWIHMVQHLDYFGPGKVFSILWHENDGRGTNATHVSVGPLFRGKYGEPIYSTIRRMVVIRAFDHYSWCFSISTYGGRGVAKPGVDPAKHAIVHMSDAEPRLGSNEPLMVKEPLRVNPERFDERLNPKSRLNFGKIYTVEHNVKVLPIGEIAEVSMPKFILYARAEMTI